jgi:hypothetical protein
MSAFPNILAEKDEKDDEKDRRDDEKEAKAKKKAAEEEDDKKKKDDESKAKKKAEEKEKDEKDKEAKASAKKKAVEDDEDAGDKDDKDASAARDRERHRIQAILKSDAAAKNPEGAEHLAFNTSYPRAEAIALLSAFKAAASTEPKRDALRERMASEPSIDIGAGDTAPATKSGGMTAQQTAALIVRAGKLRRGEKV